MHVSLYRFSYRYLHPHRLHSCPTRRSSDLARAAGHDVRAPDEDGSGRLGFAADRKSTRLNSSHSQISYAVFCLKKKTQAKDSVIRLFVVSSLSGNASVISNED